MNFEVPADAWYVWIGVLVVSLSVAGVVLSLPSEPPPDASDAANTVDRVATSEHGTRATAELDAEQARIGTKQLALRNDGGTTHASIAFGSITPVDAAAGPAAEAGTALLAGAQLSAVVDDSAAFDSERSVRDAFAELRLRVDSEGSNWHETEGRLRVRSLRIAGELVVLVDS